MSYLCLTKEFRQNLHWQIQLAISNTPNHSLPASKTITFTNKNRWIKLTALYTGQTASSIFYISKPIVWIPKPTHLIMQIICLVKLLHFLWLLHSTIRRSNPILFHGRRYRVTVHCGYVMDAWSFPLFLHCILAKEVFLSMASNLSWCSRHNNVSRNASPITLAKFAEPNEK